MYNCSSVMKCYNSTFADYLSDLQGKSVWGKRETSLSIDEVKKKKRDEMEMRWLSAFSLVWENEIL